jgi:hypothetical protein
MGHHAIKKITDNFKQNANRSNPQCPQAVTFKKTQSSAYGKRNGRQCYGIRVEPYRETHKRGEEFLAAAF